MKIFKLLKFFPLFLLLIGCRTQNTLPFREGMRIGFTPDTTALPTFPAEALYVLGAQWEADSLLQEDMTIAEYLEKELIRLYPEKAYKGYVQRLCSVADCLLVNSQHTPSLFIPKRQEINFVSGYSSS